MVDSIRYAKLLSGGRCGAAQASALVSSLTGKLRAAAAVWGVRCEIDPARVLAALRRVPCCDVELLPGLPRLSTDGPSRCSAISHVRYG